MKRQYNVTDSPRYITPPSTSSHFSDCLVTMGKEHLLDLLYSNKFHAMTKLLRVAAKAAETSTARLCAAANKASQPHPADTLVSAGSQHQPATSVAGSCDASPREDVDPELVVDYPGSLNDISNSKPPASLPSSPRGDTSSSYRKTRGRGTFVKAT